MRPSLAQLLLTGILDNTLNVRSGTTTARDVRPHQLLSQIAKIDEGWAVRYFEECQASMENRLACAIRNDAKTMANGSALLQTRREEISSAMRGLGEEWLLNVVSIAGNRSYLLADCTRAKKKVTRLLGGRFTDSVMPCRRLLQRRELLCIDATIASSRRHRVAERPRQLLRLAG